MENTGHNVVVKITKRRRDNTIKIVEVEREINNTDGLVECPNKTTKQIAPQKPPNLIGDSFSPKSYISNSETICDLETKVSYGLNALETHYLDSPSDSDYEVVEEDNTHYIAVLPVSDFIYMREVELTHPYTNWFYNLHLISNYHNQIPIFPLDNIDESFRYKTYAKHLMQQEWGLAKKHIHLIKHVFTRNNIHLYMGFVKSRTFSKEIPLSLNVSDKKAYCWKEYLISINSETQKPKTRPYNLPFPKSMKDGYQIELIYPTNPTKTTNRKRSVTCKLEEIFSLVTQIK